MPMETLEGMGWEKVAICKTEQKICHNWNSCLQASLKEHGCDLLSGSMCWFKTVFSKDTDGTLRAAKLSPILATDGKTGFAEAGCVCFLFCISPITLFMGYGPKCPVSIQIYLKSFCITWIILKPFPLPQQAEFLRLSLGFKCDLFTLDKRVKLEERSRDLAEENLKKEITNALKMLEVSVGQGWMGWMLVKVSLIIQLFFRICMRTCNRL